MNPTTNQPDHNPTNSRRANNPAFLRLMDTHKLPFRPYPDKFTKADVDERQELYRCLAEIVWDPASLGLG